MHRLALCALVLAAACGPVREDLSVVWTFDGLSCTDAGVDTIYFSIDGQRLVPDHYTCAEAPGGADLGRYLPGTYTLTVSGYDGSGTLLWQTTKDVTVKRGGTQANVDVLSGDVALRWTFNGQSCAAAGVTVVNVSLDNQVLTDDKGSADIACTNGGVDGIVVAPLTNGAHSFDLVAKVNGQVKYALNGLMANVTVGQETAVNANLKPAAPTTASADLTWDFDGKSCAAANVDHVQIFFDPAADGSGGADAGTVACSTAGVDGASVDAVPAGKHSFAIVGIRAGHLVYITKSPPSTQFVVGLISNLTIHAVSP